MNRITHEDRRQVAALIVKGQYDAAKCVERLLMDGEAVRTVLIRGAIVHVEIDAPRAGSGLWGGAETSRQTDAEISFIAVRFGCTVLWTLTRAQMELMRIGHLARQVH